MFRIEMLTIYGSTICSFVFYKNVGIYLISKIKLYLETKQKCLVIFAHYYVKNGVFIRPTLGSKLAASLGR
jgi:hypothetical protein